VPKLECDSKAALGRMPKRRHLFGGHDGDLGQLLCCRVIVDVGVDQETLGDQATTSRSCRHKY
jgi:hypothetical protein